MKERIELFKGKTFKISPTPTISHQNNSANLFRKLDVLFLEGKCLLFYAPFDIVLLKNKKSTSEKENFTVLQPDLYIVYDEEN